MGSDRFRPLADLRITQLDGDQPRLDRRVKHFSDNPEARRPAAIPLDAAHAAASNHSVTIRRRVAPPRYSSMPPRSNEPSGSIDSLGLPATLSVTVGCATVR